MNKKIYAKISFTFLGKNAKVVLFHIIITSFLFRIMKQFPFFFFCFQRISPLIINLLYNKKIYKNNHFSVLYSPPISVWPHGAHIGKEVMICPMGHQDMNLWRVSAHPSSQPLVAALPPPFASLLPGAEAWGHAEALAPETV